MVRLAPGTGDYNKPGKKHRSTDIQRMRLIHMTDPHLSSLEGHTLLSLRGKRRTGYLSWTRNRSHFHRRDILDRLVAAIRTESADQLIISGDLVQIGLGDEIRQAGNWLSELAPARQVFLVPGNHDVYANDSWAAVRRHWSAVLPEVTAGCLDTPDSGYPFVRDLGVQDLGVGDSGERGFGALRLIGASSACVRPVFSARGALGPAQLSRLESLLRESREQGFLCCLVIHHPHLPGTAKWRKALKEVKALQALIAAQQPALVLYGHLHHNLERRDGASRIYCTASASNAHDASYRVIDIERNSSGWSVRMQLKAIVGAIAGTAPSSGVLSSGVHFEVVDDQRWTVTQRPSPA